MRAGIHLGPVGRSVLPLSNPHPLFLPPPPFLPLRNESVSHGDWSPWRRLSLSPRRSLWAKPYRVCQREGLSGCVLVTVSFTEKAGAGRLWTGRMHAHTVCLFGRR